MKKPASNQPTRKAPSNKQPLDPRENPRARDARGSASRDEIRAQTSRVPAPRQSNRPTPKSR